VHLFWFEDHLYFGHLHPSFSFEDPPFAFPSQPTIFHDRVTTAIALQSAHNHDVAELGGNPVIYENALQKLRWVKRRRTGMLLEVPNK